MPDLTWLEILLFGVVAGLVYAFSRVFNRMESLEEELRRLGR